MKAIKAPGSKALGHRLEVGPDGYKSETDLFTCQHCNFVVKVKPFCSPADFGGLCKGCGGLICLGCLKRSRMSEYGGCDHILKKIERIERNIDRDYTLKSYGFR